MQIVSNSEFKIPNPKRPADPPMDRSWVGGEAPGLCPGGLAAELACRPLVHCVQMRAENFSAATPLSAFVCALPCAAGKRAHRGPWSQGLCFCCLPHYTVCAHPRAVWGSIGGSAGLFDRSPNRNCRQKTRENMDKRITRNLTNTTNFCFATLALPEFFLFVLRGLIPRPSGRLKRY
jgi:hypothetical protein